MLFFGRVLRLVGEVRTIVLLYPSDYNESDSMFVIASNHNNLVYIGF